MVNNINHMVYGIDALREQSILCLRESGHTALLKLNQRIEGYCICSLHDLFEKN